MTSVLCQNYVKVIKIQVCGFYHLQLAKVCANVLYVF
jgi:hypothetical protein